MLFVYSLLGLAYAGFTFKKLLKFDQNDSILPFLNKYRVANVKKVAKCMINCVKNKQTGIIHNYFSPIENKFKAKKC